MRRAVFGGDDEELAAIGVGATVLFWLLELHGFDWSACVTYCHGQQARLVVVQGKVLIGKLFCAVDGP